MIKKISLLMIIILLTVPLLSFGATNVYQDYNWYSADPITYIKTIYDNHNLHCIKYFINVEDTSFKQEIANHIVTYNQNYYLECKNNGYRIYLLWNDNPSNWINSSVSLSYNNNWVTCPTTMGEMNYSTYFDVYFDTSTFKYTFTKNTSGGTVFVPECLIRLF